MLEKINESVNYIQQKINDTPETGIVLGTGLGGLTKKIDVLCTMPYNEIPNFPVSTVKGHAGNLLYGLLNGKKIIAMQGRFHFYEGYSMQEITFPIRVMKKLGIRILVLSNASGGVNPEFEVGDIMILTDHINLIPDNPLLGKNEDSLGPRFPDMSEIYDLELIEKAKEIARNKNILYKTGVYAAVSGPTFETLAEYKYIRTIGADAVGMSTVPEAIVAKHMDLPCIAFSIITDLGVPGKMVEFTHEDVIEAANIAEPKLSSIVKELIGSF